MSRDYPYDQCPECKSQNTERKVVLSKGSPIATLRCYHCGGSFRKTHKLKPTKTFPGYETTEVVWVRIGE